MNSHSIFCKIRNRLVKQIFADKVKAEVNNHWLMSLLTK
jgi:hypothetical protein